jgi:NAD-dependent DNA ligase
MTDLERYTIARWAYSVGKPIMSDAEYTLLHNAMEGTELHKQAWSSDPCPVALLRKHGYSDMILDVVITDKTESIPSLNTLYELRAVYGTLNTPVTVSYKHDGWNLQASYYNGDLVHIQTRGRVSEAMQANHLSGMIPNKIDMQGKVTVIMEATASDSAFEFTKKQYNCVSQRGCVSTLLAHREHSNLISLHAFKVRGPEQVNDFKVLRSWGFEVPMNTVVSSYDDLLGAIKTFSDNDASYEFPTDGIVVAGEITRAVRIYTWEEPIHKSFVTGYKEEYGPHNISVGLEIFPIKLRNSTQSNLPATNLSRIINMNLQKGAPVAFRVVASAISDLDEVSTGLLHKTYEGRWEEFREMVKGDEALK